MRFRLTPIALALTAALTLACSPPSAEDLVQERIRARQDFQVELNSWVDRTDAQGRLTLTMNADHSARKDLLHYLEVLDAAA